jgi:hypothetical protein
MTDKKPSDMIIATSPVRGCTKTFASPVTAYKDFTTPQSGTPTQQTTHVNSYHANSTILYTGTMLVEPFVVYWQATDLPKFDTDYASLLARRLDIDFAPTATAGLTATSSSSSSNTPPASSALSTGAKAGIGIGAALLFLLFLLAALFLIKRRKKIRERRAAEPHAEEQKMMPELSIPELSGRDEAQCVGVVEEVPCKGIVMAAHELDGRTRETELDGTGRGVGEVHELGGGDIERP